MKSSPCADCGAKSFAGATIDGVPTRVVPAIAGDLVVIAWNVSGSGGTFTPVVFGEYDPREADCERRFSKHACVAVAAMINDQIVVDECDRHLLKAYRWHRSKSGYAATNHCRKGENPKTIFLHRVITDVVSGLFVDHINHEKLDNRRANLRIVTTAENSQNRCGPMPGSSSGVRGVTWSKSHGRWIAQANIKVDGKAKAFHLGLFSSLEEASRVAHEWRVQHMPGYTGTLPSFLVEQGATA